MIFYVKIQKTCFFEKKLSIISLRTIIFGIFENLQFVEHYGQTSANFEIFCFKLESLEIYRYCFLPIFSETNSPKIEILFKTRNFVQKSKFSSKTKFWSKLEILIKNPNFVQKSKFWSKIQILVKNGKILQKSKFHKIPIFLSKKNYKFNKNLKKILLIFKNLTFVKNYCKFLIKNLDKNIEISGNNFLVFR